MILNPGPIAGQAGIARQIGPAQNRIKAFA